jgi:hypothetical protein
MALFQQIVQEGRAFASSGDMNVSDMSANAPVGTTLALLERTLKVMTAVQARLHYAMKQEFKLLKIIIADYTPDEYEYEPEDAGRKAKKSDYDSTDVIPVSDPNAATMAQKIVQYQAVLQLAQSAPQLYNLPLLHRQMIEVLGIKNANKLVPLDDDSKPVDPVQENQNILTMKPVKAFVEQNHDAHMASHQGFIQNPHIQQLLQNNPMGQGIMASAMAHINEHMAFKYRVQVEQMIQQSLPPMVDRNSEDSKQQPDIPPQMADQIAIAAAQATQQLLTQSQQQVQQQAAQQQMQDPVVQMQMQELQLKQQEVQLKAQKQQQDAQAKAQQLQLEAARIASQKEIAAMQVGATAAAAKDKLHKQIESDSARMGMEAAKHKAQLRAQQQTEGARMGIDAAKHKTQIAAQMIQQRMQNSKNKGNE